MREIQSGQAKKIIAFLIPAIILLGCGFFCCTKAYAQESQTDELAISELYPSPEKGAEEWVELFNPSPDDIDLSLYTIEDGTKKPTRLTGWIKTGGTRVLTHKELIFSLNNDKDILILRKKGEVTDRIAYGNFDDGNILDNALEPKAGLSLKRDSWSGVNANDYKIGMATKGSKNFTQDYTSRITISELCATPSGGSNGEFIELFNADNIEVNLGFWQIQDSSGKGYIFSAGTLIAPGQHLAIYHDVLKIFFNDDGDAAILIDPNGEIVSEAYYQESLPGQSLSQFDKEMKYTLAPTPGEKNIYLSKSTETTSISNEEKPLDEFSGIVTAPPGVVSDYYGYMQNEAKGTQFYSHDRDFPSLSFGDHITVSGEITHPYGENRIILESRESIKISENGFLFPIRIDHFSAEEIDKYVEIEAVVKEKKSDKVIMVSLLSNQEFSYKKTGLAFSLKDFAVGQKVIVSGVFSVYSGQYRILPIKDESVKMDNSKVLLPCAGPSVGIFISILIGFVIIWISSRILFRKQKE